MNAEDRLSRLLKLLQGAIRAAGYTQTDVDDRIGRRRGYLSHVFQRRVDLKLIDLLKALDALEIDPHRFFEAAFGGRSASWGPLEGLMHLAAGSPSEGSSLWHESGHANGGSDDPQFVARVRQAVRSILTESGYPVAGGGREAQM